MAALVTKIISGGQTGADRGGLDAAILLGIAHGGWCPRDRHAEDGRIPSKYQLVETRAPDYETRTLKNIDESDGTIVFTDRFDHFEPGSALTIKSAGLARKPCLVVDLSHKPLGVKKRACFVWLKRHKIKTLNVAGHRESKAPGIQLAVARFLCDVLGDA